MTQDPDLTLPPPRWRGSRPRGGCGQLLFIGLVGGAGLLAGSCLLFSGMVHATVDDLMDAQPTPTFQAPPTPRPTGPSAGSAVRLADRPDETLPAAPVVEVEDPVEDDVPRAGLKTEAELRAEAEARAEAARQQREAREQAAERRRVDKALDEGELFGF